MRITMAVLLKLSAVVVTTTILTPILRSAPQRATVNPKVGVLRSQPQKQFAKVTPNPDNYRFVTIDVEGQLGSYVYDINDEGLATGYYFDSDWGWHNFTWRDGTQEPIEYPGASFVGMIPNNRWVLFGNEGSFDAQHAAVLQLQTGAWTLLPDVPGKPINFGARMNDGGIGVGEVCEGTFYYGGNCVGWIWNGRTYTFSDLPGNANLFTGPNSVNDQRQVVGAFADEGGSLHGYLSDKGNMTVLDVPGAANSTAADINNRGQILVVAYFGPIYTQPENYIWEKGVFTPLPNVPGSLLTYGGGINDRGDYAGAWVDANGMQHGFIAFRK